MTASNLQSPDPSQIELFCGDRVYIGFTGWTNNGGERAYTAAVQLGAKYIYMAAPTAETHASLYRVEQFREIFMPMQTSAEIVARAQQGEEQTRALASKIEGLQQSANALREVERPAAEEDQPTLVRAEGVMGWLRRRFGQG